MSQSNHVIAQIRDALKRLFPQPAKQVSEWEANPRDDHRLSFDTTHPIDTFIEWKPFEGLVNVHQLPTSRLTSNSNRPWTGS
jgi:hypothetical protein